MQHENDRLPTKDDSLERVQKRSDIDATTEGAAPNLRSRVVVAVFERRDQAQAAVGALEQQGISRDTSGNATALVINADSKAELRTVVAERTVGDKWLVSGGLADGDRVIVEGLGRIQAGQVVKPVKVGSGTAAGKE